VRHDGKHSGVRRIRRLNLNTVKRIVGTSRSPAAQQRILRCDRDAGDVPWTLKLIQLYCGNHRWVQLLSDNNSTRSRAGIENVPSCRMRVTNGSGFKHLARLPCKFVELSLTLQPTRRQIWNSTPVDCLFLRNRVQQLRGVNRCRQLEQEKDLCWLRRGLSRKCH